MVSHISTIALNGIQATDVDVQVQISSGMSSFQIVGLPNNTVKESKERIRSAFHSIGISLPAKRITVNLAPADILKEGSHYDLPIAIGLMGELGIIPKEDNRKHLFMGELSLDGGLHGVAGCLLAALHGARTQKENIFVPTENANEASWGGAINIYAIKSLHELMQHLKGETALHEHKPPTIEKPVDSHLDFKDVKGQETAKRVAEIAASGGHNMLFKGAPGAGKSMIAQRMPGILPALSPEESLEVSMVHSVAGLLDESGLVKNRPFRNPHQSASAVALCGGGLKAKPGEMSLAHRGVLFLDELPEFPRTVLETLRQPLESGNITVSRANHHITYPARFQLVAAMNPCPCGYLGHPTIPCSCSQKQIQNYTARLSGPLMDRIDLHLDVSIVTADELTLPTPKEGTKEIAARVHRARKIQQNRYKDTPYNCNAEVDGRYLEKAVALDAEGKKLLTNAIDKFSLSARGYHRVLKVARTIADLNTHEHVEKGDIAEALAYRYMQS
jgi:magnesium chelatase family protein